VNRYHEPKDGDYVAYVAELERRQLTALNAAPAPTSATAGPPAPAIRPPAAPRQLVAAAAAPLLLAGMGALFLFAATVLEGGLLPALVGAFLLWQAWRRLTRPGAESGEPKSEAARRVAMLLAARDKRSGK
jgi:hypothetical protein